MELWSRFEAELEQARRMIPGGPEGWRPERLILRDWWHWRDQEFGFAHGCLAFTGQNAGGKSSLLALTIPLLLDGRTDPARLDPAQSRDRFIHYYLLGSDDAEAGNPDAFRYEARTGYIALEFYHAGEERYLTVGMGFTASRNSPRRLADWWGFLLLKGQQIGRNGFDVRGTDHLCLGRREFTRLIGEGGLVLTEKGEYQRQVNNHLFGLEPDDYQALIEMLLQARRPKLGEQSGPDRVCDLLRLALPSVPADRLSRVGEVVNNIEEYRRNMADVAAKAEAVGRIDGALYALAEALAQEAVQAYNSTSGSLGNVAGRLKQAREALTQADQGLEQLATEAQERALDEAGLQAEATELRSSDTEELQLRLEGSRERVVKASEREADLHRRLGAGEADLAEGGRQLAGLGEGFDEKRQKLALQMDRLAADARRLVWQEGAEDLGESARSVAVLTVTDPLDLIEGAAPSLSLPDHAQGLAGEFEQAAVARSEQDQAERSYQQARERVAAVRTAVDQASDAVEQVKDQRDDRAGDLVDSLTAWHQESTALGPIGLDLERVVTALGELEAPPPEGLWSLVEPYAALAERRRGEIRDALLLQEERQRLAALQRDRLAEDVARVEADPGDPLRSEARNVARDGISPGLLPLFRQVRFREGVSNETAALVETAVLEAGWLDLLVLTEPGQAAVVDAYMAPHTVSGASLLAVLEPEPGAPPTVRQLLSSVGWGEGAGERWVAQDGRWRNGPALGQVAPWAPGRPGYVGQENRERRKARRLASVQVALAQAEADLAAVGAERTALAERLEQITDEMRRLERLPWQPLFQTLTQIGVLEEHLGRAKAALEEAKPLLAAAEQVLSRASRRFEERVQGLPGAAGLDTAGLRQRSYDLATIAREIPHLAGAARELGLLARSYRSHKEALSRRAKELDALRSDRQAAEREWAAAEAAVRTLEEALSQPDVRERQRKLDLVISRLKELAQDEKAADQQKEQWVIQKAQAGAQIDELEPQEATLRQEQGQKLDRVRGRLRLHPELEPLGEALEREGAVTALRRVPRPVGEEELEKLIGRRQGELVDVVRTEQDLLRDYQPTWTEDRNSLKLYEERIPLQASQLQKRLASRVGEYEGLIEEEQQKLFQDIIYEGILDELRRLIRQARDFTRRTNLKLKELRLSNGEELSLRLRALSPEQAPGARIALELEQMEQGSRWLQEEKREILLSTIKDEVERVRTERQARGQEITYHEAVLVALDYRHWYEYQLMSKMPGSAGPVPIRTKGFGRRSTSAKAWALSVPVLAAVAARYDASPRSDLPRLIGLDEAFAGLDPNNQANYVNFMTRLGFAWIITAPDELPYNESLSAAMTYRMSLEGSFHTAFPILWNGQVAWDPLEEMVRDVASGDQQ